ncbi:unnamed protein product [Chrysoparadoxa australica]
MLFLVQAPLPSGEKVAAAAEMTLDRGKRYISAATREFSFYVDLIDVQLTRTLTRAQWDILGYGPYASLIDAQRSAVVDRACEKYLSFDDQDPVRRYEFLAVIRWTNGKLYDDLLADDLLKARASAAGHVAAQDEWLDAKAPWRRKKWHWDQGLVLDDIEEHQVLWFYQRSDTGRDDWARFTWQECLRLERRYRSHVDGMKGLEDSPQKCNRSSEQATFTYQTVADEVTGVNLHTVAGSDVFTDTGRFAVCLDRFRRYPVYWPFTGDGQGVARGVWLQETGGLDGFKPYPLQAAALLEDAYQFLKWQITEREAMYASRSKQANVLLTVQVMDELVQFRGLDDIMSVKRTLGGALSVIGRHRVHRGVQPPPGEEEQETDEWEPLRSGRDSERGGEAREEQVPGEPASERDESCAKADPRGGRATPSHPAAPSLPDNPDEDLDHHVEHLVLVVHGIGDALTKVDLGMVQLRSLIECCDMMRDNHAEVVHSSAQLKLYESREGSTQEGRVEYLPVVWHSRFKSLLHKEGGGKGEDLLACREPHYALSTNRPRARALLTLTPLAAVPGGDSSEGKAALGDVQGATEANGRTLSIWDITLKRAALLRAFTNDTLLDVLYFMSPNYHQLIIEEVVSEVNRVHALFTKLTRSYSGRVSIAAHSLGAIICFDILANQRGKDGQPPPMSPLTPAFLQRNPVSSLPQWPSSSATTPIDSSAAAGGSEAGAAEAAATPGRQLGNSPLSLGQDSSLAYSYSWGASECDDSSIRWTTPQVACHIDTLFCLGSPVGMFLMIRGQHKSLGKDFYLAGAERCFNIYHPYDPVAYRLEPILCGKEASSREAALLPTWQGGFRVHYRVKRWWHTLWNNCWRIKDQLEHSLETTLENLGLIEDEEFAWHNPGSRLQTPCDNTSGSMWSNKHSVSSGGLSASSGHPSSRAVSVCEGSWDGDVEERGDAAGMEENAQDDGEQGGSLEGVDYELNGMLAGGLRVDYSLQEKEIEVTNDTLFALGAHTYTYWTSKDLSFFMAKKMIEKQEDEKNPHSPRSHLKSS